VSIKPISVRQRRWLASLLVLTFALRALIPVGFMPAGDGSLTLRICPDGFLAALLPNGGADGHVSGVGHDHLAADAHALGHHDHSPAAPAHDHKSWTSTHCAFGAVASAPPPVQVAVFAVLSETQAPRAHEAVLPVVLDLRHRIAQPRAPPTRLI
jgi:hypothetical protein